MTMDTAAMIRIDLSALITDIADTIAAHADELTALDQAIGDGDHGLNMKRGFDAVRAESAVLAEKPLPDALKAIGTKLVMTVGGASGPLFGTLFMSLGKELPSAPRRAELAAALAKSIDAVAARGKSQAGQKTMLDVLYPVQAAVAAGKSARDVADAADAAAEATKPMKAIRGRASFLGERSIGHMDPGARSTALIVRAVVDVQERSS
jgi:dihydroxyacetone kinase-like protein